VRVVSLVPSVTETLSAWEVEPIACTRFCERPDLPHVGGTKDPDITAIVALEPDLVVVDEEENRREDADALRDAGVEVFATAVRSIADVGPQLRALAGRLGVDASGTLPDSDPVPPATMRARAFVPIWRRPWIALGRDTYGSTLLASIGFGNVIDGDDRYPEVELDALRALAPDVVLAPSEPYPFRARHLDELSTVAPAHLVDGQDLFWWGVRTEAARARLESQLGAAGIGNP
jgi:ABC-type Fe3+-hydroxamate transport system substrate-binding protein